MPDVVTPRSGVLVTPAPAPPTETEPGLVSVVMPVYNVEPYVAAAVASVLSQSYADLELLVVDDGSTDGTHDVVAALAERDSRVRLDQVPNGGPNAARNHAIARARGAYLTFVDGDDRLLPGAYEAMVASVDASGSDFAVAPYQRLVGEEIVPAARWIRRAHRRPTAGIRVSSRRDIMVNAVQWSKLYRRDFWDAHVREFGVPGSYQDQLVSARAYGHARHIDILGRPTVAWRMREDQSSMTQQTATEPNVRDRYRTAGEALEILEALGRDGLYDARLAHYLNYDFGMTLRGLDGAPASYRETVAECLRPFADLADRREVWDDVRPGNKVAYLLLLAGRLDELRRFYELGGLRGSLQPAEVRGEAVYADLPLRGEGVVPDWCYRLPERQARNALRRQGAEGHRVQ